MDLIETVRAALSPGGVLSEPEAMAPYLVDWRRLYHGRAVCVARPRDTGEVAKVVALAAASGAAIVPQGGNTGLTGGSVPDEAGTSVVLTLERMDKIRSIDPANFSMTVEAGCILKKVQEAASAADRLFPLSLTAEGSCQIGGISRPMPAAYLSCVTAACAILCWASR